MSIKSLIKSNTTTNTATTNNEAPWNTEEEVSMQEQDVSFDEVSTDELQEEATMNTNEATNEATTKTANKEHKMTENKLNTNALSSTITAHLFHEMGSPRQAVVLGACVVDAVGIVEGMDEPEMFFDIIEQQLSTASLMTTLSGDGKIVRTTLPVSFESVKVAEALIACEFMTEEDGLVGPKLIELFSQRSEAYAPTPSTEKFVRRFPMTPEKGQGSDLLTESFGVLESNPFTIDGMMVGFANQAQHIMGGAKNDDEAYVLAGCNAMDADRAYVSEFKADRRIRLYQAACHGPNGQASDRSRAMMDLSGVTQDYDIADVKKVIKAEVIDMLGKATAKDVGRLMTLVKNNPVDFLVQEESKLKKDRLVAKPWSFVKATFIWLELNKGNKPYIGMAVGLDAKCSGPQYGAIMSGDALVAAACGMTLEQADKDAYQRAVSELEAAGFVGFTRNGVKKSFMGVFYGQGAAAFTDIKQLLKDEQFEVVNVLYPEGVASEDIAKAFHKAITKSFGPAMIALRARFKEFTDKVSGRIGHMMPDGCKVQMNYKVKVNILNEEMEFGTVAPDVTVTTSENTYKFIKFAVNTKEVHEGDFVRNGFVNMIQAVDALVARLIIVHLGRLGATNVISVHDCFRVNVTEMHLLEQAIKNAYLDLFGNKMNCKTKDLPLGQDILAMYFEGANAAIPEGSAKVTPVTQFITLKGKSFRKMNKIQGHTLADIINGLGVSYYFAK